ncbi:MAG TPA: hypothetical protein VFT72_10800 [Opitutaceae bacterium]|nr:hypothetical protein [Opitutaceae bacterium]
MPTPRGPKLIEILTLLAVALMLLAVGVPRCSSTASASHKAPSAPIRPKP